MSCSYGIYEFCVEFPSYLSFCSLCELYCIFIVVYGVVVCLGLKKCCRLLYRLELTGLLYVYCSLRCCCVVVW